MLRPLRLHPGLERGIRNNGDKDVKFGIKLFCEPGTSPEAVALIPIFHRWIQERWLPLSLIDVADYSHVPNGPGVMLVADEGYLSFDGRGGRVGLAWTRRRSASNFANRDEMRADLALLVSAAERLEAANELKPVPRFAREGLEAWALDRLLTEPGGSSHRDFAAVAGEAFSGFIAAGSQRMELVGGDPREPAAVRWGNVAK